MKFNVTLTIPVKAKSAQEAVIRVISNPGKETFDATSICVDEVYEYDAVSIPMAAEDVIEMGEKIEEISPVENQPEPEPESAGLPLPKDVPYIGALTKAGETLDSIILKAQQGNLADIPGMGVKGVARVIGYLQDTGRLAAPKAEVVEEEPAPQPPEEDELSELLGEDEDEEVITEAQVRQALADVARAKDVPTLKKLLKQYGAESVSKVPEGSRKAIYQAAMRLLA